jgi:hypothetical protein
MMVDMAVRLPDTFEMNVTLDTRRGMFCPLTVATPGKDSADPQYGKPQAQENLGIC